jgi:hypothetical protein
VKERKSSLWCMCKAIISKKLFFEHGSVEEMQHNGEGMDSWVNFVKETTVATTRRKPK